MSNRCKRCGRGGLDDDETHCEPCKEEFEFWADVFREKEDVENA